MPTWPEKSSAMQLDTTDKALLRELQRDTRQTTKALSLKIGLSPTAVYERIRKLEQSGVIARHVALLDPVLVGRGLKVFCQIRLDQHIREQVQAFEREVAGLEEVVSCYHIGGAYDYILEICVADMDAYREFMVGKLTAIKHIGSTQSSFVISQVKQTTELPL